MLAFEVLVVGPLHVGLGQGVQRLGLDGDVVRIIEVGLVGGELAHLALHAGQAAHALGLGLGFEALQILVGHAALLKLRHRFTHDVLEAIKPLAGEGQGHEGEQAAQLRVLLLRHGLHGFLILHQVFVEQRVVAAAHNFSQRVERQLIGIAVGHGGEHHLQHREAYIVLVAHVAVGGEDRDGQLGLGHGWSALDGAKVLLS